MSTNPQLVLPGTWLKIDLETESAMRSSIRKAVGSTVGRRDDQAQLRAELRAELQTAATRARENSAQEVYIAQALAAGVPLSATLSIFYPILTAEKFAELELGDFVDAADVPRAGSTLSTELLIGADPTNAELRAARQISHHLVPARDDIPAVPRTQFDYWVVRASPREVILMSFSTTFVQFEPQLTELFDAIVRTVRWPEVAE